MSEDESENDAAQTFEDEPYGDLMNLARSMNEQFESVEIDTDAPKKDELCDALEGYEPEGDRADGWTVEVDGSRQEVELLAVQTPEKSSGSSGPSAPTDATILYCLTRAETTEERVAAIAEALEENTDFELRESGSGDKFSIILPAENQEDPREPDMTKTVTFDEDTPEEEIEETLSQQCEALGYDDFRVAGEGDPSDGEVTISVNFFGGEEDEEETESESSSKAESEAESEESEEQTETSDDAEESESEPSEAADEQESEEAEEESEEEAQVGFDLAVDRLMDNNTKNELYDKAVEADIDGRTDMDKQELAEALAEANESVEPPAA